MVQYMIPYNSVLANTLLFNGCLANEVFNVNLIFNNYYA